MGLFDVIIGALNNPEQQGSSEALGGVLDAVQGLSNDIGADPGTTQSLVSGLGGYVRSALQQKQATDGTEAVDGVVERYAGVGANSDAPEALFSPNQQTQVVQGLSQRTGINAQTIQSLLPVLIPIVLSLLQTGRNTQNPQAGNNVLGSFLDSDRDGDVDIGDVLSLASQYLGGRR
jgi:hypothetical protein